LHSQSEDQHHECNVVQVQGGGTLTSGFSQSPFWICFHALDVPIIFRTGFLQFIHVSLGIIDELTNCEHCRNYHGCDLNQITSNGVAMLRYVEVPLYITTIWKHIQIVNTDGIANCMCRHQKSTFSADVPYRTLFFAARSTCTHSISIPSQYISVKSSANRIHFSGIFGVLYDLINSKHCSFS